MFLAYGKAHIFNTPTCCSPRPLGFYALLLVLCLDVLRKPKGTSTLGPHELYFWCTISLFVLGTVSSALYAHDIIREMVVIYMCLRDGDPSPLHRWFSDDMLHTIYGYVPVVCQSGRLVRRCWC